MEEIKVKPKYKTVGRPKKVKNYINIKKEGISTTPVNPDNRIEYVGENIIQFKLLFTYLKNTKCEYLNFRFNKNSITIFTRDKSKISRIVIKINCENSIWYYCDEELWINVTCSVLEKVFLFIDKKNTSKMTIVIDHLDLDNMSIIFKDDELNKEIDYKIKLNIYSPDLELIESEKLICNDLVTFPIEFTLDSKEFKTIIASMKKISNTLIIEKNGEEALQIACSKLGIYQRNIFSSPHKIDLKSSVGIDEVFRAEISIDNISALSKSIVTPKIRIICKPNSDFIFQSIGGIDDIGIFTIIKSV
jgi:hypothetical protein